MKIDKALSLVLRAANEFARGQDDSELDAAINLVWHLKDTNVAAVMLGSRTTPKKQAASRQNGSTGGRPKVRYN